MKAFNTRENDQFGWALAISRDGNTIAVGSHSKIAAPRASTAT